MGRHMDGAKNRSIGLELGDWICTSSCLSSSPHLQVQVYRVPTSTMEQTEGFVMQPAADGEAQMTDAKLGSIALPALSSLVIIKLFFSELMIIKLTSKLKEVAELWLELELRSGSCRWKWVLIAAYVTQLPVQLEPSLVSAKTR